MAIKIKKYLLFVFFLIPGYFVYSGAEPNESNERNLEIKDNIGVSQQDSAQESSRFQKVVFRIDDPSNTDAFIEKYLKDMYPIISDAAIREVINTKTINKFLADDTLGLVDVYAVLYVPKNYLDPNPKILWELNLPEFTSRIYQTYDTDTILIDVWPNVIGKPSTKTYTGHYDAFRIRNWPFWKDPEAGDSVKPTPPGPNNPLGLFVVHYDENSLRYFHGTNKNYLLKNEYRALSHGCVRNDNSNIAKMKEFIIKKVIKSNDLSSWLGSSRTMAYELKDDDKFPVRIIYKTFDINRDESGDYLIFFKDVYNYSRNLSLSKFDDPSLITLSTLENILSEFKQEHPSTQIPDEELIPMLEQLISGHKDYQKYYFRELIADYNLN